MSDVSIEKELLSTISAQLYDATDALSFSSYVRVPGDAGLNSTAAEEALAAAAREQAALAEVLWGVLRELAERPVEVAEQFALQDRVLGETR
ncbi:hypothetical protein [Agromyces lapidis]|uniref:Uncharacterized protein n=1 Tax=Agromyces lapidis TaxID=279574 RepID=A0ABV5SKM2_9MICO|nr:hypothetical protein [Agromyces lapidis]